MKNQTTSDSTFQLLAQLLRMVWIIVCLCVFGLLYGLLGEDINWFQPKSEIDEATYQRRFAARQTPAEDKIENGIHLQTGLIYDEGFEIVRATCTACHSAKLVTQNRATRQGWSDMIDWMQETQGLWELGKTEPVILDYLAKHYAPKAVGRRATLEIEAEEWYILELDNHSLPVSE